MLPPPEIISWSKRFDVPVDVLMERLISLHWDLFAAIVVPVDENVELSFCGLNGKAYYKASWYDRYVTARQLVQHYRPEYASLCYLTNPTEEYRPYRRRDGK